MNHPPRFVDLHCHLLPGLDDGADDWEQSLTMARMAAADGTSIIIATPHQLGNFGRNRGQIIRHRCAELRELLDRHDIKLQVLPGADVRIEPEMIAKLKSGEVLTLADRHRHVLLELPHEVFLPLDRLLDRLKAAGLTGVLSHPERNQGILARPRLVEPLVAAGCLMQVTAGALTGTFGSQAKRLAQSLVEQQLVHFIATDAHGAKSRRPLLRSAFDCVSQLVGHETAVDLCCRNPAAVAAGKPVDIKPRKPAPTGWFRWKKVG